MQHLTPHARPQLLMTRRATGNERTRGILLGRSHLREKIFADRHAQFVVLAFVAEAAGHPATLYGRRDHIEAARPKNIDGLTGGVAGPLLAMRVVENPGSMRRAIRRKDGRELC